MSARDRSWREMRALYAPYESYKGLDIRDESDMRRGAVLFPSDRAFLMFLLILDECDVPELLALQPEQLGTLRAKRRAWCCC